jgi:hypothetical protein
MDVQNDLLDIERKLWTNNAVITKHSLIEDAVLVFAETGPITRDTAVEAIHAENAEGRKWEEVEFRDVQVARLTEAARLLTYSVAARREREQSVVNAFASSVYVHHSGSWKLAFHQQTPIQRQAGSGQGA